MPNWNPLTNAVGGAGATPQQTYYTTDPTNFGEYQYIKLTEIIDNFVATYTGEGKILANVLKGDIHFHAHRALQELSYDTLRSCKTQEIEVCPSLCMPLPHDYVNYVKLTSTDANGIEHVIYPTRFTGHPFAIEQDDCEYQFENDGTLKHQDTCVDDEETSCDGSYVNAWSLEFYNHASSAGYPYTTTVQGTTMTFTNSDEWTSWMYNLWDAWCACASGDNENTCGTFDPECKFICCRYTDGYWEDYFPSFCGHGHGNGGIQTRVGGNGNGNGNGGGPTSFPDITYTGGETCTLDSNTWSNYSSSGNNSVAIDSSLTTTPATDAGNYFQNVGQRYGLVPEHAQMNGSFFIDCMRGQICFSSNFSGKTITLHYISDHHGTENEMIVPKLAEEAMYKWIAYGCAQARTDVDQGTIARLKKERFAETRKAKIRISNIKTEEIAQIMRNKSKWIDH